MSEQLKPCPFCGSDNVEEQPAEQCDAVRWVAEIYCHDCDSRVSSQSTDRSPLEASETVVDIWNRRTPPAQVPRPHYVDRLSDQSVMVTFSSCRLASVFERMMQEGATTPTPPAVAAVPEGFVLEAYDAGLLGNGGGGNVDWWQDYIRSELGNAHDFYQSQLAAAPAAPAGVQGEEN